MPATGKLLAALLLGTWLWLQPLAPAPAQAAEDQVTLNFVNADIETVTKAVAQITGKSFILDPRVKGTVNVVSSRPVPQSLAYHYLLSALRMQGFAAVESHDVVRILPESDAKTHAGPTQRGLSGDQLVTRVFPLQHETANNMVAAIRPLVAPNNPVSANAGSNSLVISDYADNLKRLEKIIAALDTPYGLEPQIIPVQHGSAIDLANTLNRIYGNNVGQGGQAGARNQQQELTLFADPRSNALIVRTDSPSKLSHVRSLVASLDLPGNNDNIHVIYLKNAEAAQVARTLRAIVSNDASADVGHGDGSSAATAATSRNPAASSNLNSFNDQAAGFIQADVSNNALIITAPGPVYNNLRRVIDMLDRRRAQVLVEALIVELTSERANELGVQWLAGNITSGKNTATLGGTNFGTGSRSINGVIENLAQARTTGSLGLAPGLNLGIISDPAGMGVLIRALENDANANILSTPNLLTLDNEEAKIVIGSNVPFISGQYAATGNSVTATPFQTYERKDVGLMLKVKPQISEGGLVRLQIYQEASSIQDNTLSNVSGPSTNKRSIETAVVVDDGATVVIGGLIQDSYGAGEDKVPLLGDIPGIGNLFRYETRKRTKTNLMVFLRPHIVRDAAGNQKLTTDRYDYIIGEQKKAAATASLMRNEDAPPLLPQFNQALDFNFNPPATAWQSQADSDQQTPETGEAARTEKPEPVPSSWTLGDK